MAGSQVVHAANSHSSVSAPLGVGVCSFLTLEGRSLGNGRRTSTVKRIVRRSGVSRLSAYGCLHTLASRHVVNGGAAITLQQIRRRLTSELVRREVTLASAHDPSPSGGVPLAAMG